MLIDCLVIVSSMFNPTNYFRNYFLLFLILCSGVLFAQTETVDTMYVCKNQCVEIGIKKKRGFTYQWKAFGEKINSSAAKVEVCPKKLKNLYYVDVFNKKGENTHTYTYKIFQKEAERISIQPSSPCVTKGGSTEIKVVQNFGHYEWSNGMKSQSITVDKPQKLSVMVKDKFGCELKEEVVVSLKKASDIKKYFDDKGFYGIPIQIEKKKDKKGKKN